MQHALQERVGREDEKPAAEQEQPEDDQAPGAPRQAHDAARDRLEILHVLGVARRQVPQHPEIDAVNRQEHDGVDERQRGLPPDEQEVEDGQPEGEHLDGVLPVEVDAALEAALASPDPERGDGVDERPAEPDQ